MSNLLVRNGSHAKPNLRYNLAGDGTKLDLMLAGGHVNAAGDDGTIPGSEEGLYFRLIDFCMIQL